jgi:hypothetical protein
VVEVAEGFSGKLQAMHEEMVSQISEVGKQIRFLSDQIGDNRSRLTAVRSDLATEMVRLNEALGATRVQIREDIAGFAQLKGGLDRGAGDRALQAEVGKEIGERFNQARRWFTEELDQRLAQLRQEIGQGIAQAADQSQSGAAAQASAAAAGAEGLAAEVRNEVKATHKALTGLAKKFERFDDKMSVQVKDHDQRLRKLERSARG